MCRARKTKCDNKRPSCTYCESVGATCIQSPVDLSSFDPASLKILDRLDDLERLLRSAAPPLASVSAAGAASWRPWGSEGQKYPLLVLNVTAAAPHQARFALVDGYAWEGGRGERCALWAKLGAVAQE